MKTNKVKSVLIGAVIWLVWVFVTYYFMLPPINAHSTSFWAYLGIVMILPIAIAWAVRNAAVSFTKKGIHIERGMLAQGPKVLFGAIIAIIVVVVVGTIAGAKLFHARGYASILKQEQYEFSEDIDQTSALSMIALMDTNSAIRLGNREIGSLTDLVSQYDVSSNYSQISYKGQPVKVSALRYAGFFKWTGNRSEGVPGYVKVDPVAQNADYVALDKGMKYVPSAYFNDNLERHLRFKYPTAIFDNIHFEVDEEGNPYYVASVMTYKMGLFGGQTVKGAVICDPETGDCEYYDVADVPQWADDIFDGELLCEQYNWYGELSNGFWNSVFGKKGCKKCTETLNSDSDSFVADYGYIAKDGDIWIYTGVTSVNDDASNIGFILINQRTSEAHYYVIAGADENSAMSAAEGEVQEKGYDASFPSLINVDEQPTYVMVLKDSSGIVKLYAMVNVEQYNIVTTAANLDDCFTKYRKLIGKEGLADAVVDDVDIDDTDDADTGEEDLGELVEAVITIESIQYVDINGNTYVYLEDENANIYRQKFADNEKLITLRKGQTIRVTAKQSKTGTYFMEKFEVPVDDEL